MDVATPLMLMRDLEPLTHRERTKRLVELGRRSKDDADARATIAAMLRDDDAYVRACAVATVYGSGDGSVLVTAASDRARTVRARAFAIVPRGASDEDAERVLDAVTGAQSRTRLVAALRRKKRFVPIDRFLARRLDADDPRSIDALPLASTDVVRAHVALVLERGSPVAWARLAKLHPKVVFEHLSRVIAEGHGAPIDPRLAWRLAAVARVLARADVDAGLALLATLFDRGEEPLAMIPRAIVDETLKKKPAETFDAVRKRHLAGRSTARPGAMGVLRLDKVAHRIGAERLAWTVEHAPSILSDGGKRGRRWLLKLSEGDREAVIEAWLTKGYGTWGAFILRHVAADGPRAKQRRRAYEKWSIAARGTTGIIGVGALGELPDDLRIEEARRHLALPALATKPNERIAYAALLPFEDAEKELAPFLGHPEGEVRGMADRILLSSIERDRASLARGLAFVRARKFEQDPVRMAMLGTLAKLPVVCFAKEHLADVGAIVQDALDAADLSYATAAHAEELIVRLFRVDGDWGAQWLVKLLKTRGSISNGELASGLLPREVDRLAPAIASLVDAWATKERSHGIVWLARALGKRLDRVPALLDALERLAREQPFASVSAVCLAFLRAETPERFVRLAPELVASDPSYVLIPDVATFISTKRQDMLSRFVSDDPIAGRFATGRQHWVLYFRRGFGTWTSTQQGRHADALVRILKDEERDVPTLRWAIETLTKLSFAPRDALLPFAADPRPAVREIAIRALPWLDGAGLATLLACLGDDRARWAIYALRKAFADMSRADVIAELRKAPMKKVTVAKEVIRLFGELGGADGYGELVAIEKREDVHRDVRIALLRAMWDHLERPPTWDVFERAVAHPDWVVASKLADVPLGRLTPESEARVAGLLVRILGRNEPEARLDLLKRAAYLPLTDRERILFRALVERMGAERPDEATTAANAALIRMKPDEVAVVVDRMKELLPRRRLALALLPSFNAGPYSPKHRQDVARGVLDALARDRLAVVHRIRFAGGLLSTKELAALLRQLSSESMLFADALVAACEQARRVVHPDSLDRELGAASDPRLRRVALEALAHAAAAVNGWTSDRRERLVAYRADPDPLVAAAAAYVFLPEE